MATDSEPFHFDILASSEYYTLISMSNYVKQVMNTIRLNPHLDQGEVAPAVDSLGDALYYIGERIEVLKQEKDRCKGSYLK